LKKNRRTFVSVEATARNGIALSPINPTLPLIYLAIQDYQISLV